MPRFPESRRGDVIEEVHGEFIPDPYRWLEDPDNPETVEWVRRQNAHAEERLAALPGRAWFTDTVAAILAGPRVGVPSRHAGRYLVSRNDGAQNQDVVFVADSADDSWTAAGC